MPAIKRQFEVVREIGDLVLTLMEIGTTPASLDCPRDDDGRMLLEEDEGYWQNLEEIKDVFEEYGFPEVSDPDVGGTDDPFSSARVIEVERVFSDDLAWRMEVCYYAYGGVDISARVLVKGVEKVTLDPYLEPGEEGAYKLTPVDIGRMVARTEVTLLAQTLGSSAEILDYWMTDELSPAPQLTQEDWGSIRGVSRQAVNENVNSARTKLEEN